MSFYNATSNIPESSFHRLNVVRSQNLISKKEIKNNYNQ